jgi:hypothetical protein
MSKNKKARGSDRNAHGKSWVPGRKGQGGEGLSKVRRFHHAKTLRACFAERT